MKMSVNRIVTFVVIIVFVAIAVQILRRTETNYFEGLKNYDRGLQVIENSDTLEFLIQPTPLEEVNPASMWLFVDLIGFDTYKGLKKYKNYKYIFLKNEDSLNYTIRSSEKNLIQNYSLHTNCPNLLKMKRYIYDSCSYNWVTNGNKALLYLKNKTSNFDSLTGGKYIDEGKPDIISIMTGMGINCCFMKPNNQLSFLLSLDEISKDNEFRKIWPEYYETSHIKNILNMCFKKD